MSTQRENLQLWWGIFAIVLVLLFVPSLGLNTDGVLLLSLRYSILDDPLSILQSWNYNDATPCSWHGISCDNITSSVTSISLPNSQLLGSLPADLGMIEHLQRLDLSSNSFNGSLPYSLFNHSSELKFLDLSNNMISGELSESIGRLQNLEFLNLSDNALAGNLPKTISTLHNLTVISLKGNYFSGNLPSGFEVVEVLDLSSNLINGSLPPDFGGKSVKYLNISNNKLSGQILPEFGDNIPGNATLDLSFNNLTGKISESAVFINQDSMTFSGNPNLCGEPIKNPCPIPSSSATSPPAIAAIPMSIDSKPRPSESQRQENKSRALKPAAIVAIVVADIAGIAILSMIILYIYNTNKKKDAETKNEANNTAKDSWSSSSSDSKGFTKWSCLRKRAEEIEESSDSEEILYNQQGQTNIDNQESEQNKTGKLVNLDGDKELELETLLKASAYILGASGSSIMYKAVLENGKTLAVRRIGESNVDRFKDFENQVRVVAKLVHPNLVRVRGFYWGVDEKLIIYDFVPNGCLANARYRKVGSSPCHLPWEPRLKIARGVAKGLAYLHEKKHVHGNLKPSNILLGADMEPKIGDFGLERLITGDTSSKAGWSSRNFGSKRSTASRENFQDHSFGPSPSPSPSPSSIGFMSPYIAPESLRSLKPNPKWDVYSFGVILLELITGKVIVAEEMGQNLGIVGDDKIRILRMADGPIRAELEGKEESLLSLLKLGYNCASSVPHKRPSMKEVLHTLEKISHSSLSSYYYGH